MVELQVRSSLAAAASPTIRARAARGGVGEGTLDGDVAAAASSTPAPKPCRVEAAQRLVERHHVVQLGVVGEQRHDVAAVAEHVVDEALQGLLRADLDEDARAGGVQRLQALDELHRLGDLAGEDVEHPRHGVAARSGRTRRLTLATIGRRGGRRSQPLERARAAARWPGRRCGCGRRG